MLVSFEVLLVFIAALSCLVVWPRSVPFDLTLMSNGPGVSPAAPADGLLLQQSNSTAAALRVSMQTFRWLNC